MRLTVVFIALLIWFISTPVVAQEPGQSKTIEDLIEEIANSTDAEIDYTSLYEDLNYYLDDPLNINTAEKADLEKMQFLSDFQIEEFLKYRKDFGNIVTIYELKQIPGFTQDIIELILPFITLEKNENQLGFSPVKALKYGTHQLFLRTQQYLEKQQGYKAITDSALWANPNSRYLGSPQKYYFRYAYSYKSKLSWGLTAEKDPGEVFFKNNVNDSLLKITGNKLHTGFDFYSAHLFIKDLGPVKTLAIGDFQAQFGQGLTLWSGLGYGKSSYVLDLRKRPMGIKKYSSVDENLFLRGIGSTVRIGSFDFTGFWSRKLMDATVSLVDTIDNDILEISSIGSDGLHATPSSFENKDCIRESMVGGNISFNRSLYRIGATAVYYSYDAPLHKNLQPYNQFEFMGTKNTNLGLDYQLAIKNITVFGEAAMSENGGMAFVNGLTLHMSSQVIFSTVYRNYNKDYQAMYGSAFGENSKNANEKGLFFGVTVYPFKKWKLNAYIDSYIFPWLRYQADAPSSGYDWVFQADYAPSSKVTMYCKLRQKIKSENETGAENIPGLAQANSVRVRYHISYQLLKNVRLSNRFECSFYKKGDPAQPFENGFMVYQDLVYKPAVVPVTVAIRYAIFGTDSYNTAIYAYENDILYSFSVPAYYSKGSRFYITTMYSLNENIDLWLRYSQTYFQNTPALGSGITETSGPVKSEIKIQLRIRF